MYSSKRLKSRSYGFLGLFSIHSEVHLFDGPVNCSKGRQGLRVHGGLIRMTHYRVLTVHNGELRLVDQRVNEGGDQEDTG